MPRASEFVAQVDDVLCGEERALTKPSEGLTPSPSPEERGTFPLSEMIRFQKVAAFKNVNFSVCRIGPLSLWRGRRVRPSEKISLQKKKTHMVHFLSKSATCHWQQTHEVSASKDRRTILLNRVRSNHHLTM
jgi:hypothetical protein